MLTAQMNKAMHAATELARCQQEQQCDTPQSCNCHTSPTHTDINACPASMLAFDNVGNLACTAACSRAGVVPVANPPMATRQAGSRGWQQHAAYLGGGMHVWLTVLQVGQTLEEDDPTSQAWVQRLPGLRCQAVVCLPGDYPVLPSFIQLASVSCWSCPLVLHNGN